MKKLHKQAFETAKQQLPKELHTKLNTLRKQGWVYAANKAEADVLQRVLPKGMTELVYQEREECGKSCVHWRVEMVFSSLPGIGGQKHAQ